jgi:2,5-diamino-6-(ribosylamino)-4(3H)-pyrimidinone 5'-phosphate reductase
MKSAISSKTPRTPFPKITAHFAITTDGKISTKNRTPSQFTSPADKKRLRLVRAVHDAVLVARGTVAADTMSMRLTDPALRKERTARGLTPEPLRVVMSNSGRLDSSWKIFKKGGAPLVILSTTRMPELTRSRIAPFCDLHLYEASIVPLESALKMLRKDYGVKRIVCEGGGQLFRSLAELDLLTELQLTIAPVIFGGAAAPSLTGIPGDFLPKALDFRIKKLESIGDECVVQLVRTRR